MELFSYITNLDGRQWVIILVVLAFSVLEVFLRVSKNKLKVKYRFNKDKVEDFEDMEKIWIEYYKKTQQIFVFRIVAIFISLGIIIGALNIPAFNAIAIIAGTIIVVLRDYIFSFISFFYIISIYKIGDDIKTDKVLGEILRINPLYVAIAGKDEEGDYDGKLHRIPNSVFVIGKIEIQELKMDDYRKVQLTPFYSKSKFDDPFDVWLKKIKDFLEDTLPARNWERVGHFRGYLGVKYKLNYEYNDKGELIVMISFIARPPRNIELKEKVVAFIESLQK